MNMSHTSMIERMKEIMPYILLRIRKNVSRSTWRILLICFVSLFVAPHVFSQEDIQEVNLLESIVDQVFYEYEYVAMLSYLSAKERSYGRKETDKALSFNLSYGLGIAMSKVNRALVPEDNEQVSDLQLQSGYGLENNVLMRVGGPSIAIRGKEIPFDVGLQFSFRPVSDVDVSLLATPPKLFSYGVGIDVKAVLLEDRKNMMSLSVGLGYALLHRRLEVKIVSKLFGDGLDIGNDSVNDTPLQFSIEGLDMTETSDTHSIMLQIYGNKKIGFFEPYVSLIPIVSFMRRTTELTVINPEMTYTDPITNEVSTVPLETFREEIEGLLVSAPATSQYFLDIMLDGISLTTDKIILSTTLGGGVGFWIENLNITTGAYYEIFNDVIGAHFGIGFQF